MTGYPLVLFGILLLSAGTACSLNADLALQQLNHRAFTPAEGAPTNIYALAQTSDGSLWIAGGTGLSRFDGIRFVPYPGPSEEPLPSTNISSLTAAPDGGLWIGFRLGGVSLLKGGRLLNYTERDGFPGGTVDGFAWDREGSLWAVARGALMHLKGKRWERVADEAEFGSAVGVLVDRPGTLWLATVNGLFARVSGESRWREISRTEFNWNTNGGILAESPDGKIWAGALHELVRIDPRAEPQGDGLVSVRGISGGPLLFDNEGNLWGSDAEAHGLVRVSSQELTRQVHRGAILAPEKFARADELDPGAVFALLEDREQNVWVGTENGLDRFSHSNVVRASAPACHGGDRALAAGDAAALWIVCSTAAGTYVDEMRDGAVLSHQITPNFDVAYRDPQGTVWFGGPNLLGRLENHRIVTVPLPEPARGHPVQALVRDGGGGMWVSVVRKGIFRWLAGEWSAYGNLDPLPRGPAIVETADGTGNIWFGYPKSRIARMSGRAVQLFDARQGLEVGNVQAILARGGDVWAGGELGLARFDGTRFVAIHNASGAAFNGISGIVTARNGDLWLNGMSGITHIARQELERAVRDAAYPVQCETFDYLDGVPGTAVQLRPLPSAVETTDGHIWFSMSAGIVSIDAANLVHNTLAPPVTIWSLTSGGRRYPHLGAGLLLPVHTANLQIEYSAGSLTVPERVRFRYKLEGSDRDWQEAGTRREALYTNLGPGHYTFRVTASNNDGVWNTNGASIEFIIPPTFYQTKWFYAVCLLVCVAILTALYRVRVRQVAAQVRGRLEARLAERERIARELHDTLLQGMQGLIWRFQAATDRIPPGEPARQLMEQSLDRADKLLGESRDRVKDLRPTTIDVADLAQALAAEGEQLAQLPPIEFRVSVQGAHRGLHPIVREEVFLVCREALRNAFQHSGARNIEAEVTYGHTALHVRIRDDGQGIGTTVLDAGGKPGHFGLIGMRERANKLGGQLDVWSKPGAGTEIDLRVPANVAYRRSKTRWGRIRSRLATFCSTAESH